MFRQSFSLHLLARRGGHVREVNDWLGFGQFRGRDRTRPSRRQIAMHRCRVGNQIYRQLRTKFESYCLNDEQDSKKTQMSANEPTKLATDSGAREQKRLITIAVAAESVKSDSSRVHHRRGELDSIGRTRHQSEKNRPADEGEEQQSKNHKARERDVVSRETRSFQSLA